MVRLNRELQLPLSECSDGSFAQPGKCRLASAPLDIPGPLGPGLGLDWVSTGSIDQGLDRSCADFVNSFAARLKRDLVDLVG